MEADVEEESRRTQNRKRSTRRESDGDVEARGDRHRQDEDKGSTGGRPGVLDPGGTRIESVENTNANAKYASMQRLNVGR